MDHGWVVTSVVIWTIFICTLTYFAFFSMNRLPEGRFIKQIISPDGKYVINFYLVNGGATTSYSIRGELLSNRNREKKNIYWEYRTDSVNAEWLDEKTVLINGHRLNIPSDVYDWRREKLFDKIFK
ncbi:MAG: DUF5412 family protein [Desulfurispora sp.]|uniref:DUF5412 family protein n=1 Tax=Desulfurispora sp. TaxID=3014275 RepID=UPI00404A9AB5